MLTISTYFTTFFLNINGSSFYYLSHSYNLDFIVLSDVLYSKTIENIDYDDLFINDEYILVLDNQLNVYYQTCLIEASFSNVLLLSNINHIVNDVTFQDDFF